MQSRKVIYKWMRHILFFTEGGIGYQRIGWVRVYNSRGILKKSQ